MNTSYVTIIVQLSIILIIVVIGYITVARRDKCAPVDDIGVFWLIILALYTILPPVFWLLQGGKYISPFSGRLFYLQPSADEVITLLNIGLAYALGFGIVYLILRRKVPRFVPKQIVRISNSKMAGALIIVLSTKFVLIFLNLSGIIPTAKSYIDQFHVVQQLPLALKQALKIITAISSIATTVFLIAILQRWPKYRWWLILYLAIILFSFDPNEGRSGLAIGLLSVVIGWHVLVRRIPYGLWIGGGFLGLVLFLLAGMFRGNVTLGKYDFFKRGNPGVGEFDALWGNAVELLQNKNAGRLHMPFTVRFGEFWEFIPSQFLPFHKSSVSIWFLETYHQSFQKKGGGWVFGAISQAVIGNGVIEAGIRGIILGILLGWLMKWYRSPSAAWWHFPVFLHLMLFSFMSIRESTFQQIGDFVQIVLPSLFIIAVLGAILSKKEHPGYSVS